MIRHDSEGKAERLMWRGSGADDGMVREVIGGIFQIAEQGHMLHIAWLLCLFQGSKQRYIASQPKGVTLKRAGTDGRIERQ